MEIIKEMISCKLCHNRLVDPVVLPGGAAIYNEHSGTGYEFKCTLCSNSHEIPLNGFVKIESIAKGLEMNIDQTIFGDNYAGALENLSRLKNL